MFAPHQSKHEVVLSGIVHKMCSDSCFKLFRTANQLTMAGCANCGSICHVRPLLLKMEGSSKTLCNLDCLIKYKKVRGKNRGHVHKTPSNPFQFKNQPYSNIFFFFFMVKES